MKKNLVSYLLILFGLTLGAISCDSESVEPVEESCSDGIKNQDETDVDCGGVCNKCIVEEPNIAQQYFVKFKLDGVWESYQRSTLSLCQRTGDVCWNLLVTRIFIDLNNAATPGNILALKGKTFSFNDVDNIDSASFGYKTQFTSNVPSGQQDGTIKINNVVYGGDLFGIDYFIASGTFSCKIAESGSSTVSEVTEGSFNVYFFEE